MTARTLALLLLAPLAACTAPGDSPAPEAPGRPTATPAPVSPEASGDVAREARLSDAQADDLRFLGEPILLPRLSADWSVRSVETDTEYGTTYVVLWRRADGACLLLNGSNDGLGGPQYPIVSAEVTVRGLPGQPRYKVYKAADDPASTSAEIWGAGTVVSDYVTVGGTMSYWLNSYADEGGCRPLSLEEGAEILSGLRPLAPLSRTAGEISGAETAGAESYDYPTIEDRELGVMEFNDGVTADAMEGDPLDAVRAWTRSPELDDPEIEVLSRTPDEVRILATRRNLPDDSVRDERTLFVFERFDGALRFMRAGDQWRCWPNRGHQDWSARYCS